MLRHFCLPCVFPNCFIRDKPDLYVAKHVFKTNSNQSKFKPIIRVRGDGY